MKRTYRSVMILPLLAAAARSQEPPPPDAFFTKLETTMRSVKVMGAVMGPAVKGAPYSAVEVSESTQMLADGTRIHREERISVYRDSEGRMRRETPDQITIWDPVAGTTYSLDPKAQTWRKLPLAMGGRPGFVRSGDMQTFQYRVSTDGALDVAGLRAEIAAAAPPPGARVFVEKFDARAPGKSESLGRQTIEGVNAEGTRMASTIETGAIGNDRPIESVSETWYSPELQTLVKSVHRDPRMGEDTFQLTNISRVEQPVYLFQVPATYQPADRK
ncbi:MAG: hypothetical protein C5B51_05605 [Terriglobia bacterium]|nr:MAG: hypothetical protein C5B51_05605 [Terriglobia bacterium]